LIQNAQIWQDNTCGEGHMYKGQSRPIATGRAPGLPILGFPSIYAYIIWLRTARFDEVTHILVFRGQPHPISKRRAPALPNFGGSLSMTTSYSAERPRSARCHMKLACIMGSATPPVPREFQRSEFWGFPVFRSPMPIPFNAERPNFWRGNTYETRRGVRLLRQPRHCICTNALRGLSATTVFLVSVLVSLTNNTGAEQTYGRAHANYGRKYTVLW